MFEGICEALHRELDNYDNKLMGGKAPMSTQDLENIDKMAHALKSLKSYIVMVEGCEPTRRTYTRYREDYPEYRRY